MWFVEPWDTPAAVTRGWPSVPAGWTQALVRVWEQSDVEAAPSHGCSLDSPWGGSPGTATGNQHCPWEALGSPALCWPQIPLSYLVVGLLSGAACAHVPASLNTDTRLGSPCSGSVGLLWEELLLTSRADAEIRNCSLFSWTFSPLGLAGRGPSPGSALGPRDGLEQRLLSSSTEG